MPRCEAILKATGFRPERRCWNDAKVLRGGKQLCHSHDPVRLTERKIRRAKRGEVALVGASMTVAYVLMALSGPGW